MLNKHLFNRNQAIKNYNQSYTKKNCQNFVIHHYMSRILHSKHYVHLPIQSFSFKWRNTNKWSFLGITSSCCSSCCSSQFPSFSLRHAFTHTLLGHLWTILLTRTYNFNIFYSTSSTVISSALIILYMTSFLMYTNLGSLVFSLIVLCLSFNK